MNARSVRNKTTEINDFIIEQNADILLISETWLKDNDVSVTKSLLPPGYSIVSRNRKIRSGGGVAIVYRNCFKVLTTSYVNNEFSSFECCHLKVQTSDSKTCLFSCIYRPPKSAKNVSNFTNFISDFNELCENLSCEQNLYIFGDFNIHFENALDKSVNEFKYLIDEHDLTQCIDEQTHINGHTLDLCLYRCVDKAFVDFPTVKDKCISDHFVLTATLPFHKPKHVKETVQKRNVSSIDLSAFQCALSDSFDNVTSEMTSFIFHDCVTSVLNKFAPLKNKLTTLRPAAPWINLAVKAQKQIKRRAERLFRKTRLTIHKQIFKYHKNKTIKIINEEKKKYITEQISKSNNSKQLYSIFNNLTTKNRSLTLPSDTPPQNLPDKFNQFFIQKISSIRTALDSCVFSRSADLGSPTKFSFTNFSPVSQDCVKKTIMNSRKSFSELDSLPRDIFIQCIDILTPHITTIFNESLISGVFPSDFKNSLVIPLIKKLSLDCNSLKNYRPVSNLSFISKILEKLVFNQIVSYLKEHKLIDQFQSAYKTAHSTETALLKVINDLLCSIDEGNVTVLTLLDLSAAFDTLDHDILFNRLSFTFGIKNNALNWFKTYLENRNQKVKINNFYSDEIPVNYGVPQGSVLGPLLFTLYIYPISNVINKNSFSYHQYADDTQLYACFKPDSLNNVCSNLSTTATAVNDWMSVNKLKMNNEKTEVMLCGTNGKLKNLELDSVQIGSCSIKFSNEVKDLGIFIDKNISFDHHISHLRKCCYAELRKISTIRPFINESSTVQLCVSLILSKIDYCNCLFYGMSKQNFHKLQLLQNHAARLVKRAHKRSSATSLLKELHWLPVFHRVNYKIALIVFKSINVNDFPAYLKDLICIYSPSRSLRSSDSFLLAKPLKKLKLGQRSFEFAAPEVWNSLPFEIRSCDNLSVFKKKLKTHYFRIAFS